MIKGVLFDLDGTLFDRDAAIRELLETQYSEFEVHLRPIPREAFTAHVARLDNHGGRDKNDVYRAVARDFGLTTDIVPTLVSDFWQRYHELCRPFSDVLQTLEALRRNGKKIAVVTNGRKIVQEGTIAALHLSHLLDAVLISEVEGVKKPDRRIFERAVARLGLAPSECCHVGDHPDVDVGGALAAGLRAIWKRVPYWPPPTECVPSIDDFAEILVHLTEGGGAA
jgi:putative hydrolase of the HAD superfamily